MGMDEGVILDYPLDKFFLYSESARRVLTDRRKMHIRDTAAAIAGVFDKGGVAKQLELLDGE